MLARTDEPFAAAVTRLLEEKSMPVRRLATAIGVDQGFLSRVLQGKQPPSPRVIEGVGQTFGLPPDYFLENRLETIGQVLSESAYLADTVYDELADSNDRSTGIGGQRVTMLTPGGERTRRREPAANALALLRPDAAKDPETTRLAAAAIVRYERDETFRQAVDRHRDDVGQTLDRLSQLRKTTADARQQQAVREQLAERALEIDEEIRWQRQTAERAKQDEERQAAESRLAELENERTEIRVAMQEAESDGAA